MSFQLPIALLGLLAIPLVVAGYLALRARARRRAVPFADIDVVVAATPRPRARRHLPLAFMLLAIAGLTVALARPEVTQSVPRDRATIMLAIDVSRSMGAEDVEPYRLRAAQDAAKRFAEKVPRHFEVGLVSFSGSANTLLPPTADRPALLAAIDGLVPDGATAIGDAVLASLEALRAAQPGVPTLEAARILLLSDGANTEGASIAEAAQRASELSVPVDTVALGTPDGILYPDGKPVPPDAAALAALAEATGGQAFESRDAESVNGVYEELGSFVGTREVDTEVTAWPAGIAALLLVLSGMAAWRFGPRLS